MSDEFENDQLDNEFEWGEAKSKSQVKRELHALRELGRELIALSKKDVLKMALEDELTDAVLQAQSMTKGALKRQVGFVGGIIARLDHEAIQQKLEQLQQPHKVQTAQFHQLESWRDRLLAEDNAVITELRAQFADFDNQHVRQLVRNARQEAVKQQPPKSARLLFQYLQQCQQNQ